MAVTPNVVNMPNTVKQSGPRIRTQLGVLHSAECPMKRGYPMSLTEWTIRTAVEASWHEFVGPGVVVQAVHSDYIAWHASVANWISWGTEQTGYAAFSRAQWLTKDGRDQLERLAMQWAGDAKYFGWKLEDLRWLPTSTVRAIVAGSDTTTKGFCTHAQIDPASRTDPGPNYPYDLLMQRVRAHFTSGAVKPASNDPKPIQEDDDMPNAAYYESFEDQPLKAGEWTTLGIEDGGSNRVSLVTGAYANLVDAVATVYAKRIAPGYSLKLEWFRVDADGKDQPERGYGAVEVPDTAGGCAGQVKVLCNMPSGGRHRLRLRAFTYQDGVVVKSVRARAHYWK